MISAENNNLTPIEQGIKKVGIGKRGSKGLSPIEMEQIVSSIMERKVCDEQLGAFIGALIIKGIEGNEDVIKDILPGRFDQFDQLVRFISPDEPTSIQSIAVNLLQGGTLCYEDALITGKYLFSDTKSNGIKALIASILRVRYETDVEYNGLLDSMHHTINKNFLAENKAGGQRVQIAEPFDGVDHSNLITPLIANYLRVNGYQPICLAGRNSGPKFGNNLLAISEILNGTYLFDAQDLNNPTPDFGWIARQIDLSLQLDRWVDIRHKIIKRPFLATLERFINPFKSDIMIASAFHSDYGQKMIDICKHAGFKAAVIIRCGMEGTIAFPLMRPAKVLCMVKINEQEYEQYDFDFSAKNELGINVKREEKLTNPSIEKNCDLIREFAKSGKTNYPLFDFRVMATCAGLSKALEWINGKRNKCEEVE